MQKPEPCGFPLTGDDEVIRAAFFFFFFCFLFPTEVTNVAVGGCCIWIQTVVLLELKSQHEKLDMLC